MDVNNFNNIFNASITLFVVGSLDGWSSIMYIAVNSDIESKGPIEYNNEYSAYFYFISFILFGQIILVNLFIGVIFFEFSQEQRRSKHKFLDEYQIWWVKLQKKIVLVEPDFIYYKLPENRFQKMIYKRINNGLFKFFMNLLILTDIVILCLFHDNASPSFKALLEVIHLILNFIFLVETILKLTSFGYINYFHDFWNCMEFLISFTIFIDIGMFLFYDSIFYSVKYIPRIIRAVRVLKLIRVLRVIKSIKVVQKLLQTLKYSLPMVLNVCALLMLTYYIYVLFGCHFFKSVKKGKIIDEYINFKNFSYALMTLFKVSTADSWENIMFDIMQEYGLLNIICFL